MKLIRWILVAAIVATIYIGISEHKKELDRDKVGDTMPARKVLVKYYAAAGVEALLLALTFRWRLQP